MLNIEEEEEEEEEEDNVFKIPVDYKAHEDTKHIYTKWRK